MVNKYLIRRHGALLKRLDLVWYAVGFALLLFGTREAGLAQPSSPGVYTDARIFCAGQRILLLLEGNFGALIMVGAGVMTVLSAAFGAFRVATSMLIVACAAFILRSLVLIFFNANEGIDVAGAVVTADSCEGTAGGDGGGAPS